MASGGAIDTLSVLFTDVVGSTELRARLAEDGADRFRRLHDEQLAGIVTGHAGEVVKGLGDGIMATFASAADAVAAAVAMQQLVDAEARVAGAPDVAIRIGVSVGDVSCEHGDVFGAPVVEASRLCGAATGGEILVADLVRALTRGRGGFTFEPMGDLTLKGIPDPVAACRVAWAPLVEGAAAEAPPLPALLVAGASTAYVGRDDVRARLEGAWRAARAGRAGTVLLAGEPGIGKTRTAAELARVAVADGAVVLYGRCDEDLGMPYQPFVEALDWYTASGAAETVLGRFPGELARLLPDLGSGSRACPRRSGPTPARRSTACARRCRRGCARSPPTVGCCSSSTTSTGRPGRRC